MSRLINFASSHRKGCPVSWLVYAISIAFNCKCKHHYYQRVPTHPNTGQTKVWVSSLVLHHVLYIWLQSCCAGPRHAHISITSPALTATPGEPFFSSFQTAARKFLDLVSGADILAGNFSPSSLLTQTLQHEWNEEKSHTDQREKKNNLEPKTPYPQCTAAEGSGSSHKQGFLTGLDDHAVSVTVT